MAKRKNDSLDSSLGLGSSADEEEEQKFEEKSRLLNKSGAKDAPSQRIIEGRSILNKIRERLPSPYTFVNYHTTKELNMIDK